MEKILITGAAGFIGSNLAKYLLENTTNKIYGLDNFTSSTMSNLYPLLKNDRFHFEEWDLVNEIPYTFEKVYHLAGCGDLRRYLDNKYDYCLEQIKIIKNIIKSTQENGARLILTTNYCDYNSLNNDLYLYFDTIKLIVSFISELAQNNKINANIARIDYVYGPNMTFGDNRYIPSVIFEALQNNIINIESNECCYYTFIDDVVKNLDILMNNYVQDLIIDVINSSLYLKSDIYKLIVKCCASDSIINENFCEISKPNYSPNIIELGAEAKIQCTTSVLEGISKTIQHVKLMYFS